MMKPSTFSNAVVACLLAGSLALEALGCSGGSDATSPAQSPTGAAPKVAPEPSAVSSAKPTSEPAPTASASASSEPAPPPAETSKLSRPVKDIITAPTIAFQFNFNSSEITTVTEARCSKESAGDPKKNAECMQAARDKQPVNVHRFQQKGDGWVWSTYERRGNQLVILHKFAFEFGEETKDTVEIKPIGKDQGLAPIAAPRSVIIKCPDEFSIEITDPKLGRMVFDGKLGLVPN